MCFQQTLRDEFQDQLREEFQEDQEERSVAIVNRVERDFRRAVVFGLIAGITLVLTGCGGQLTAEPKEAAQPDRPAARDDTPENTAQDTNEKPPLRNPFARRTPAPSFDEDMEWINTGGPINVQDLRGKFVVLDFWTYCCINCLHILPELKKLERAYPNEVVVIGVHSAKFETEKQGENIRQAVLRYEIEHPVVNDSEMTIWRRYGITGWPALRVIDPQGKVVAADSGEIDFETLDRFFRMAIPFYKAKGLLDETPLRFELERDVEPPTPLRYPGKVLTDAASDRLYIADTGHNRIVVASLAGKLMATIGSGRVGRDDGAYEDATFDRPHGMALLGKTLYVADTQNHLIRKIDLTAKEVTTIAGTGKQNRGWWPGMDQMDLRKRRDESVLPDRWASVPRQFPLGSPWALAIHGDHLYIAMAGPHQIWRMTLDEKTIEVYAGNGKEDIIDGRLVPPAPPRLIPSGYGATYSAFAQPSGLASDGKWLYVADSEGSSIRAVPFDREQEVKTLVGTSELPGSRLFIFGDRDGKGLLQTKGSDLPFRVQPSAETTTGPLLQHATGVAYGDGMLYVADTYNDNIKRIDLKDRSCTTIAGKPGAGGKSIFDEPAGLAIHADKLFVADMNNHQIRTVDLRDGYAVKTLTIQGLTPPAPPPRKSPALDGTVRVAVAPVTAKPVGGKIDVTVRLALPAGWKINTAGPMNYQVRTKGEAGPVDRTTVGKAVIVNEADRKANLTVPLSISADSGRDDVEVYLTYFYCRDGSEGICKVGSVVWDIPLTVKPDATAGPFAVEHQVP